MRHEHYHYYYNTLLHFLLRISYSIHFFINLLCSQCYSSLFVNATKQSTYKCAMSHSNSKSQTPTSVSCRQVFKFITATLSTISHTTYQAVLSVMQLTSWQQESLIPMEEKEEPQLYSTELQLLAIIDFIPVPNSQ